MTDLAAASRPLRALWGALSAGGLTALVVLTVFSVSEPAAYPHFGDAGFYACALYGTVAIAIAFFLLHRMTARLAEARTDTEALGIVRSHGAAALVSVESSAVLAGLVVLLTGNVLALAFGAPLVAFAALTWPTEARISNWLSARRR